MSDGPYLNSPTQDAPEPPKKRSYKRRVAPSVIQGIYKDDETYEEWVTRFMRFEIDAFRARHGGRKVGFPVKLHRQLVAITDRLQNLDPEVTEFIIEVAIKLKLEAIGEKWAREAALEKAGVLNWVSPH